MSLTKSAARSHRVALIAIIGRAYQAADRAWVLLAWADYWRAVRRDRAEGRL